MDSKKEGRRDRGKEGQGGKERSCRREEDGRKVRESGRKGRNERKG